MKKSHKKIVVLGAGFAGIRIVQDLSRKLDDRKFQIVLIDHDHRHVFHGDLYEVATAFSKKISEKCISELRETVATPIDKLIDKKNVKFLCDQVLEIKHEDKTVTLKHEGLVHYDYLVVALGSVTNYFGIEGLQYHSFELKSIQDALVINCHLDDFFKALWMKKVDREVYFTIGGGGATGVELAAELVGYLRKLCNKYQYPFKQVHVQLIEGTGTLAGMPEKGTDLIIDRFKKLGIKIYFNRFIAKVTDREITMKLANGRFENIPSDFLVWTGGVMVNPVVADSLGSKSFRGAMIVNPYLQSFTDRNIFAAGDNAYFVSADGQPLPMIAHTAYEEGTVVAKNLLNLIDGRLLEPFVPRKYALVVPLGGRYAIYRKGDLVLKGFLMWWLKRFIFFKYSLSIMSFWKALRKTFRSTKIFLEND